MMRKRVVVGAAAVALTVSACGGGDGGALASGEDYSVLGALAELPAAPEGRVWVETADLRAASELAEHPRPETLDPEEATRWVSLLGGGPQQQEGGEAWEMDYLPIHVRTPTMTQPTATHQIQEFHDAAGWSVLDVEAFIEVSGEAGVLPDTVLVGEFADETIAGLPEVDDGVRTIGEGADGEITIDGASAVDQLGRPIRVAHEDGRLALSLQTDTVQDWLGGRDETLADHEGLAALATALDEAEVVAATLSVGGPFTLADHPLAGSLNPDADTHLAQLEEQLDFLPEHAFDAAAVGRTVQDGEPVLIAAYYFGDDETAEASVESVRTVFSEGMDTTGIRLTELYDVVDIAAEGPVLTATLHPVHPQITHQFVSTLDRAEVPFLHQ